MKNKGVGIARVRKINNPFLVGMIDKNIKKQDLILLTVEARPCCVASLDEGKRAGEKKKGTVSQISKS